MRLSIFAYHVSQIMQATAPATFGLYPCEGVRAEVEIKPIGDGKDAIWDHVSINGNNVGNRHAGVAAFTALVNKVKPVIEYT